jgi:UDP:flavonoid glycosyltransferase YjiC (YdhE family)
LSKFLCVTAPVTGHVVPLLPLVRELVERGNEVGWYTSARFQPRIEATGARFLRFRNVRDVDYHDLNALFPERAALKGLAQGKWDIKFIIDINVEQYHDLLEIAEEYRPDAVVGDTMAFAAGFLAEKLGLKLAFVNVINYFPPSRDAAPDGLALAPSSTTLGRLRNLVLNWLVLRVLFRDVNTHYDNARRGVGLAPSRMPLFEAPLRLPELFLQATIPEFEYPRSDYPPIVHFIGALLPDPPRDFQPPEWWKELGTGRPVILVTQGTIATSAEDLLVPAIRGLAKEDVLVVATTGGKSTNVPALSPLPANVRLEPFLPFAQLLPHVSVMVTNGGYGGTHYALVHGVPLVAAGQSEDKAEVCARIAWSGVGINLKTSRPEPGQIRDAVTEVLTSSRYRDRARTMRDELSRYDAPTRGAELIETLVDVDPRR